ncbi:hypothetical protein FRC17_004737, partial [Serendipita sp. 399]
MAHRDAQHEAKRRHDSFLTLADEAHLIQDYKLERMYRRLARHERSTIDSEARDASWRIFKLRRTNLVTRVILANRGGHRAGSLVGARLGVYLGISPPGTRGKNLEIEERKEAAIDLHGLHGDEAVEYTSEFLRALEEERFLGL